MQLAVGVTCADSWEVSNTKAPHTTAGEVGVSLTALTHSSHSQRPFAAPIHSSHSQLPFTAPIRSAHSQLPFTAPIHSSHSQERDREDDYRERERMWERRETERLRERERVKNEGERSRLHKRLPYRRKYNYRLIRFVTAKPVQKCAMMLDVDKPTKYRR